jgi:hypothetical protein
MNFREAIDAICARTDHEDVAKELGVSLQTVRQARMAPDAVAYRSAPDNWKEAVIRLTEKRTDDYRRLAERLRANEQDHSAAE